MRSASHVAPGLVLGVALGACSPHSVEESPEAPVAMPASFGGESAQAPMPERWWLEFGDRDLDRLVQHALADNFDLHVSWARLTQAMAAADQAGAPRWPELSANLGASFRRFSFPTQAGVVTDDSYGVSGSLAASYEIDLWNRLGSTARAAALEREAAADGVESMAMSLAAEVTEAWLDLVQVRARRKLLERQREINQTFVELLEVRFGQGLSSVVEINQQRQLVLENDAQLELTTANEKVLAHRLAVLLGKPPGAIDPGAREELPDVSPLPGAGIPSELLKRRPDIRAAQRRVEATDHRVAAAIADRYPSLRLSGSLSSEPSSRNDWLLDPIYSLAAGIVLPLIDGGRRAAEVDRQRGAMREMVATYGKAVLTALVEVENALVQEQQQVKHIEVITQQLEVSQVTLEQAQQRYGQGLSDFLTVLTALRSQQQVEQSLLAAERQLLSHRIQLCRALGGTWMAELTPPDAGESS